MSSHIRTSNCSASRASACANLCWWLRGSYLASSSLTLLAFLGAGKAQGLQLALARAGLFLLALLILLQLLLAGVSRGVAGGATGPQAFLAQHCGHTFGLCTQLGARQAQKKLRPC